MGKKIDHGEHIAPIGFLLTLHCYCELLILEDVIKIEMNTDFRGIFLELIL